MNKTVVILFIIATAVILGGGIMLVSSVGQSPQVQSSQNAKAEVSQKTHNWGKIPYGGGNVTKMFTIKNSGTDVLRLTNVKTSCACTQAQVTINGEISPYFGMHTTSLWVGEVAPGKEAKLTVIFDPAFHGPTGVGPMSRIISVETSDASNARVEFTLTGTVVK